MDTHTGSPSRARARLANRTRSTNSQIPDTKMRAPQRDFGGAGRAPDLAAFGKALPVADRPRESQQRHEFTQNGFPTQRSHTRLSSQRSPLTHPTPIRRYVVQKGIAAKPKSCDKPARHFAYTRMRSAWGRSCLSRSPSCARSSLPSAPTVPFHRTQSSTLCAGRAEPGAPPPRAARWRRHEASDIFGDTENQSKKNNNNNQDIGEERGVGTKSTSSTRGWRARSSG